MTSAELLQESSRRIPRRDAENLLIHVAGRDRAWLLAHPETELPLEQADRFWKLVWRREANEPMQYLTGWQEFFGMDLRVTPDVLIPRPETELLVEAVLAWAKSRFPMDHLAQMGELRVLDVGTGSGAIALALAKELPQAEVWAVDLSEAALSLARGNAERLQLAARIRFELSDLLAGMQRTQVCLDVVVSNPPYVPACDAATMQPEVRDHEPHLALFAGQDGLEVYRRLIPQAFGALRRGGLLAMELGFGQRDSLAGLLDGWCEVRFVDDYAGIPRVALAIRP